MSAPAPPRPAIPTITAAALRDTLERGERVIVLDVRKAAERAEWAIPGSRHVDAYAALWAKDPQALAEIEVPMDTPVVTVCGQGKTSLIAAERLRARGIEARSLAGGMRAWSLAWNTAFVPVPGSGARVLQVRRTGKGCLSYLLGSDGEAAVVDPSVDLAVYTDLASRAGWRITTVLDTHIHADHLSRARALAALTRARLCLPANDRASFAHAALRDGDVVSIGGAQLEVLHTPGHTGESVCYLLDRCALFSGDTLFLESVGRPDLNAAPADTRERAHALYRSLQGLLRLAPDTRILPCHTSQPVAFDRRPLCASLAAVRVRVALLGADADAFVETVLSHIPPTPPPNHVRIVELNEVGELGGEDPTQLEAGANRCAVA